MNSRSGGALLLVLCCACAPLTTPIIDPSETVATLVAAQQYQQALAFIAELEPVDARFAQLTGQRSAIAKALSLFEKNTAERVAALLDAGQWRQGQIAIDQALEKNPLSPVLRLEQQRVSTVVTEYSRQQRLQLAILYASYLPREQTLLDNLQRAQPGGNAGESLREKGLQSRVILWRRAQQQVDETQWLAALKTIKLVNKLNSNAASEGLQLDIEQHISEQQQQRKHDHRNQKIDRLVAAVAADELIAAEIMAQAFSGENQDQRLRQALRQLQLKIDRSAHYVQLLIDSGQKYYTEGLLDRAIFSWQKAVTLAPDNRELKQLLERALLFQSNYRKLQDDRSQVR